MPAKARISGTFRDVTSIGAKVAGTWQNVDKGFAKVSGVWNEFFSSSQPAFELISTTILSSTTSSVTFSSIPTDYTHLQLRFSARGSNTSSANIDLRIRFNSDSGSNYIVHRVAGNGSSAGSFNATSQTGVVLTNGLPGATANASAFGAGIVDIYDYQSSTKNTTVKSLYGSHITTSTPFMILGSGLWINTAPVTTLNLTPSLSSFASGSRFSLYGIKG